MCKSIRSSKYDGIKWNNVSDLKGHKSDIKLKYGVQAIPESFLIDENGFVIKKQEGFDEEDEDFISKIKQQFKDHKVG